MPRTCRSAHITMSTTTSGRLPSRKSKSAARTACSKPLHRTHSNTLNCSLGAPSASKESLASTNASGWVTSGVCFFEHCVNNCPTASPVRRTDNLGQGRAQQSAAKESIEYFQPRWQDVSTREKQRQPMETSRLKAYEVR